MAQVIHHPMTGDMTWAPHGQSVAKPVEADVLSEWVPKEALDVDDFIPPCGRKFGVSRVTVEASYRWERCHTMRKGTRGSILGRPLHVALTGVLAGLADGH